MNEKLFRGLLIAALVLGIISVIVLVVYTYILQGNASIISYIGNGR